MKKWEIKNSVKVTSSTFNRNRLMEIILQNRGLKTDKEKKIFLNPKIEDVIPKKVGIDSKQLKKAITRIKKAITNKEQIVVFGDYDVDGITGSAILWETLHGLGAICIPYIPSRIEEGYGLSKIGIENLTSQTPNVRLIITTDNGIVADQAVTFANEKGIDVIITDHHTVSEKLPDAYAIVHTTQLCGAGVAWVLTREILKSHDKEMANDHHLELAALGTVADLVPLTGANRTIVMYGLPKLRYTKRIGLKALFKNAGIDAQDIGMYEIGYIISPRLNASGRLASAMDSLRLLCTKNVERANDLSANLEVTNKERQLLLKEATEHAIEKVKSQKSKIKNLLIVAHETYPEGVIGLVAGRLVEAFYRPAIVIAKGEKHSKASARSISGFNIIEFLRLHTEHFVNVGGHPMAAGFTIETEKIISLTNALEKKAMEQLHEEHFIRKLAVDCELPLSFVDQRLYNELQKLAPFGMNNPEPTFVSRRVAIESMRFLGAEKKHVKFGLRQEESQLFDAMAFGMADQAATLKVGDALDIVYTVDENTWNGNTKLQLRVKDFK